MSFQRADRKVSIKPQPGSRLTPPRHSLQSATGEVCKGQSSTLRVNNAMTRECLKITFEQYHGSPLAMTDGFPLHLQVRLFVTTLNPFDFLRGRTRLTDEF